MMESQSDIAVNEQVIWNSDDQQLNNSLPLYELIDHYKKRSHKAIIYSVLIFGIIALIGLILILVSFFLPKYNDNNDEYSSTSLILISIGSSALGFGLLFIFITGCCSGYKLKQQFNDLDETENGQQPIIWRLDEDEWSYYLDYIHGSNRKWIEADPLSCFCCRRSSYERLENRQYGHIILYRNGFIIDELYFISFRYYLLEDVQLLPMNQHQQMNGLRFYTYFKAGKGSRNIYFDVFAPSSVSFEQLQMIAQSYHGKIAGSNGYRAAMAGYSLAEGALRMFS